jgi:hypothetical protein
VSWEGVAVTKWLTADTDFSWLGLSNRVALSHVGTAAKRWRERCRPEPTAVPDCRLVTGWPDGEWLLAHCAARSATAGAAKGRSFKRWKGPLYTAQTRESHKCCLLCFISLVDFSNQIHLILSYSNTLLFPPIQIFNSTVENPAEMQEVTQLVTMFPLYIHPRQYQVFKRFQSVLSFTWGQVWLDASRQVKL